MITSHNQQISAGLSHTQETATSLYNLGLNVFPQPFGKKAGLNWKQLQYTRLHPSDPEVGIKALFAGRCNIAVMCGRTSQNLFVIDCESIFALNNQIGKLRERNIPLWIVRTSRGGHIYLHCSDGEVANIEPGIIPNIEIRGSNGYVLSAGSVHPTGATYDWIARESNTPPSIPLQAINWLHDADGRPIRLKLTRNKTHHKKNYTPLSRSTQDYLRNGHILPEGSRNNRLFSAACDMLGNNYSPNSIKLYLLPIAKQSGLPEDEIKTTLHSANHRQRQPARTQRAATTKNQYILWQQARSFAETHQWQGRSSTTDKLVFLALTECARNANEKGIFRASIREISILARTSLNPVKKALKRLKNSNLIFYAGADKTSTASLWRFSNKVLQTKQEKSDSFPATPPWISWSESLFHSTDAAERGALGYTGLMVYEALRGEQRTLLPKALSEKIGIPAHRVNYALRKLREYELVQRDKDGWRAVAVSSAELDERVARPAGKLGRGASRRARYAEERARYVGRIILRSRMDMFCEEFLAQPREMPPERDEAAPGLQVWRCLNCGQQHFADVPPDTCDFCQDMTTWERFEFEDSNWQEELDDPIVQEALRLGAEIYIVEGGRRRRLGVSPPP